MQRYKPHSRLTRGAFSDKGAKGRSDDHIRGPIRLLSAAGRGAYLRSHRPDARSARRALARSPLKAMSGITLEGRLLMVEQERAFKGPDVVRFLKHALRQIPGKLLIIWDGSPIHRAKVVKGFLADGAAARVQLEQLPGYAPDLNPEEGIS
jgi:hypothetical protein